MTHLLTARTRYATWYAENAVERLASSACSREVENTFDEYEADAVARFDEAMETFRRVYDATPADPDYADAQSDAACEAIAGIDDDMDLGGVICGAFEADQARMAAMEGV